MNQKPADLVKVAVLSDDEFQRMAPLLADLTKGAKQGTCKDIISLIKKIIKSKSYAPPQKLRALKLLNSCMLVANVHFLQFAQKKVMSRFVILASYKKEISLDQRGEGIFGKESANSMENKAASIEFLQCLLEYIKLWAGEFGRAPDKTDSMFYTSYMKLKDSGVRFPTKPQARNSLRDERKEDRKEERKEERRDEERKREERKKERVSVNKGSLKATVENILSQFESISDENFASDFVAILEEQERDIEIALQEAMNSGNEKDIEMLCGLTDKVQLAISRSRSKRRGTYDSRPSINSSPAYQYKSPEKNAGAVFDIFDLAISPPNSNFEAVTLPPPVKATNFATHQPINLNNSPAPSHNFFPEFQANPVRPAAKEDPRVQSLQLENSQLKEALEYAKTQMQERDLALQKLRSMYDDLVSQNDQLLLNLSSTKKQLEKFEKEQKNNKVLTNQLENDFKKKVRFEEDEPPKLEKKTTFDLDLDFILNPASKPNIAAKPAPSNLPKLFDSSSSDEQEPPHQFVEAKPDSNLAYRMGNCMEMGVLFEDDTIQIGFQVKRQASELMCMILIGNKGSDPIVEIATEVVDFSAEAMPFLIQPVRTNDEVVQNTQATRMVRAQLCDFTSKVAQLKVSIRSKFIQNYCVKLPLTIMRFVEARQELPTSIWNEWKKLVFEEDTSVVNLAVFNSIVELCGFLCCGTAFRIYSQQEIEELAMGQLVGAGQMAEVLVMFSVTVLQQGTQANFSIRCRNNHLRTQLGTLIKMQIAR